VETLRPVLNQCVGLKENPLKRKEWGEKREGKRVKQVGSGPGLCTVPPNVKKKALGQVGRKMNSSVLVEKRSAVPKRSRGTRS